jgi:hypothetical protein
MPRLVSFRLLLKKIHVVTPVLRVLFALSVLWNVCALGQQPKPLLPDPKLTPGDVFDVTIQDICVPGYSKTVRAVPRALRKQAYAKYGITSPMRGTIRWIT